MTKETYNSLREQYVTLYNMLNREISITINPSKKEKLRKQITDLAESMLNIYKIYKETERN